MIDVKSVKSVLIILWPLLLFFFLFFSTILPSGRNGKSGGRKISLTPSPGIENPVGIFFEIWFLVGFSDRINFGVSNPSKNGISQTPK